MVPRQRPSATAVLVTIHGRAWPGTLRARFWSEEHQDWLCSVEIWVDDRGVIITVPAERVEVVASDDTHHG